MSGGNAMREQARGTDEAGGSKFRAALRAAAACAGRRPSLSRWAGAGAGVSGEEARGAGELLRARKAMYTASRSSALRE